MIRKLIVILILPLLSGFGGQQVITGGGRKIFSSGCPAPSMEHLFNATSLVCTGGCVGGATVTAWNDIGTVGGSNQTVSGAPVYTTGAIGGVDAETQTGTNFFSQVGAQYTTGLPVTYYAISGFVAGSTGAWVGGGNGQLEVRYSSTSTTLGVELLNEQNTSITSVTYTGLTNGQGTAIAWQYNTTTHDASIWRCQSGTCTLGASGNGFIASGPTDLGGAFQDGLFFQGPIAEMGWVTSGNPLAAIATRAQCKFGI